MQANFLVWRQGDRYLLLLAADLREASQKRLQMFVLRAKVKLAALTGSSIMLGLSGPQAEEVLAESGLPCPAGALATVSLEWQPSSIWMARVIRSLRPNPPWPPSGKKLTVKARPAGNAVWRWLDIQAAFPAGHAGDQEEFVPQMADFEKIGGVSFHKGCYPGQKSLPARSTSAR